jgi:hypothetical protein
MSRPPIYPKKVIAGKQYYRFRLNATTYSLFDDELNTAIFYGPLNSYNIVKKFLPKNSVIFYFMLDKRRGLKKEKIEELIVEQNQKDTGKRGGHRPANYPKKAVPTELLYFYIEVEPTIFVLFDADIDTPVIYGGKQNVAFFINNKISKNAIIFYFKKDKKLGLRYIATYNPVKTTVETSSKKQIVEKRIKEVQNAPIIPEQKTS